MTRPTVEGPARQTTCPLCQKACGPESPVSVNGGEHRVGDQDYDGVDWLDTVLTYLCPAGHRFYVPAEDARLPVTPPTPPPLRASSAGRDADHQ